MVQLFDGQKRQQLVVGETANRLIKKSACLQTPREQIKNAPALFRLSAQKMHVKQKVDRVGGENGNFSECPLLWGCS